MSTMQASIDQVKARYQAASLDVAGQAWSWLDNGADGDGRDGNDWPAVPMVMLHGSAADALMFVRPLLAFSDRHRIVSISLPALSSPFDLARGLAVVIDHLGLRKPVLVGSSFGAWLAPFYAALRPDGVAGLLLGNGFVDGRDLAGQPLFDRDRLEAIAPDALHREWVQRIDAAPASDLQTLQATMIRRKPAAALQAHFLAVVRAVACGPLALAPERIVVLDCDDDPVIPAAVRDRVAAQFPGARRVSLATGGHYPHVLNPAGYEPVLAELLVTVR